VYGRASELGPALVPFLLVGGAAFASCGR